MREPIQPEGRFLVVEHGRDRSVLPAELSADYVCDQVRVAFRALAPFGPVAAFGCVFDSRRFDIRPAPRASTFAVGGVVAVASACARLLDGQIAAGERDPRLVVARDALRAMEDEALAPPAVGNDRGVI